MSDNPVSRAQWHWVRHLDGPENETATEDLIARHPRRGRLGDPPVRWAAAVGDRMAIAIRDSSPDWPADHSEGELKALRRSCAAAVLDSLIAIVTGDRTAVTRASEPRVSIGYYIRRGLSVDHMLRTVRAGRAYLLAELFGAIDAHVPPAERTQAQQVLAGPFEVFWAAYQRFLTETWAAEHERWALGVLGHRYQLVLSLLEGPTTVTASQDLGYPLTARHVSAVIRTSDTGAPRNLLARVHQLASASGCTDTPLVLPRGPARLDVWFPLGRRDPAQVATELDWPAGLSLAFGEAGAALEGFRSSYRQAEATNRVARLRGRATPVTRYADVERLAVLTAQPDLAVTLARRSLGPLAGTDVRLTRLRETLSAYLASGRSISATAAALEIHRNTIRYRLRQIEKLIPGSYERTELRAALLLAAELPDLVLTPDSAGLRTPPDAPPGARAGEETGRSPLAGSPADAPPLLEE